MREMIRQTPLAVWALLVLSIGFQIGSMTISYEIANYKYQSQAAGACKQAEAKPSAAPREQSGEAETKEEPSEEAHGSYLARCWSAKIADEANDVAARQLRLAAFNSGLGGTSTILAAWAIIAALIATKSEPAAARGRVVPESPNPLGPGAGTQITFRNFGPGAAYVRGYRTLTSPHPPDQAKIRTEVQLPPSEMSVMLAAGKKKLVLLPVEVLPNETLLVIAYYSDDGGDRHAWRLFKRDSSGVYVSVDYRDGR